MTLVAASVEKQQEFVGNEITDHDSDRIVHIASS